jgi:hypothetical protein
VPTARVSGEREAGAGRARAMAPGEAGRGEPIEDARDGSGSGTEDTEFEHMSYALFLN